MAVPATQPGGHLKKIRSYFDIDLDEDEILLLIDSALKKAEEVNVPIDVHYKFPDGESLAGLAVRKKWKKIDDLFSKYTSLSACFKTLNITTGKQDAQSGPSSKKRKVSLNDGKTIDTTKNTSQSHNPAPNATYSSKQKENTGLRSFLHGIAYQLKLILIMFAHAYDLKQKDNDFQCTIATEDPEAGKFDDIVYKYYYQRVANTVYIQAKHKKNPYKIVKNDLTTSADDSPFAIVPYLSSFLDLNQKNDAHVKEYVLTTNASIHENLLPMLETVQRVTNVEIDSLFTSINDSQGSAQSSCYKFNWGKLNSTTEYADMIAQLRRCSNSYRLAKLLAEHIHSQTQITLRPGLFKAHRAAIFTGIVGKLRHKQSRQYYVSDSFLPPNTSRLREMFEEEYKKLPNVKDVWQDVALKGVKVSDGFMKDSEKLPKTPLPDDEVTDGLLEDFFRHFILVCSTVSEEELDNKVMEQWENTIVPQLCTDQLSSIATENACAAMTEYVFNWMKSRNGGTMSERDIESFYAQIIHKIQFLQLQGVTDKRLVELQQSDIEIERERLETYSFHAHLSSTNGTNDRLLHRSHYDTGLVAKIVWKTLELQTTYEYIFLDDESYWRQHQALEGIFVHLNKNITLVVECKSGRLEKLSKEKFNNEHTNHQKKVILIEQIGAEEMEADSSEDRFLMRDLTPGSKRNIFDRHKNSRHFGSCVQLEKIVDDEDDLMYLFDLTKQSQQSQANDIIEQRYSKIEPWYIDRTVNVGQRYYGTKNARFRTTAQMKNFTNRELSLSTFCSELTEKLEIANNLSAKRFDVGKIRQQMRVQKNTSQVPEGNKMHIIMDEPGIGKTTYLTWLAKELQRKHPCNWIIPLISIEYATDFAQLSKAHKTIDRTVALRFLFELLYLAWYVPKINRQSIEETDPVREEAERCSDLLTFNASNKVDIDNREASKLDSLQLAHLRIFQAKYNDSKMIILFDAFDEIAPHYKEVVLALFVQYNSMPGIAQIYLTSRPNMFESDFQWNIPPNQREFYRLEAFSERDQIVYLDKFLRRTLKEYATLQGTKQGNELLCILHNITDELLGDQKQIPLFMSISSELLLPLVQAHVAFSTNGITVSTNLIEESKKLFEPQNIMKKFIDRKLYILKVEKTDTTDSAYNIPAMQIEAEELNQIKRRKHTLLAMYAMCDESEIDALLEQSEQTEALKYMDEVQLAREKSGIVEAFNGHIPQFLHRNIAEFLVAEWIFNNIAKENVRSYLLSDQYWFYSKRVIRDYLNRMLASGSLIHQAVINQHSLEVEAILKTKPGDAITFEDVGGRTPLHLASEVGNLLKHRHRSFGDMFSALLKAYSAVINQRDKVFRWTALEYALRSDSFQAIPELIHHGAQVDANVLAEQILYCSKDPYEMLQRAALYETHLRTSRGLYLDRVILTNRMVAQTLISCENLNVYAPIGKKNETALQICTEYNAVELLKSLLLPNNVIDLAFKHDAVDVMEVLVTSEHDIPTTIHVTEEILEKCAQRGNAKLFEILFQKYGQQNHVKHMEQEQGDGLGALKHFQLYWLADFCKLSYRENMLSTLQVVVSKGNLAIVKLIIKKSRLLIDNEVIKCLILKAAFDNLTDHEQLTSIFQCLLEESSDIRATDDQGRTLLHCFVNLGYVYMVKYLIEKKGFSALTVNAVNGWNAFHYCIPQHDVVQEKTEQYYCQILSFMMEMEGPDGIHAKGLNGENLLYLAVTHRGFKVGKLIVASILENVPAEIAQHTLKEYLEQSNLSANHICKDFLNFLLEQTDVQDGLKDVFESVRNFLQI